MAETGQMLAGRVVIVTGGGRGIGRSHCLALASQGATVVVNDPGVALSGDATAEDPAAEVVAAIEAAGGTALANAGSVSDYEAVQDLVASTVATYGRLDAVVNNAGITRDAMITSLAPDDFDAVLDVHVKGTFNLTKHACTYWRAEHKAGRTPSARIVNTTSGAGLTGNPGQIAYSAAKAAIATMTMTTAMEGSRYGVTVNCVSPIAATRMSATIGWGIEEGAWDRLDPANSSPLVAWLCSVESGWITGRVLRVDGASVYPVKSWEVEAGFTSAGGERLDPEEIDAGLRGVFGLFPPGLGGLQPPAGR